MFYDRFAMEHLCLPTLLLLMLQVSPQPSFEEWMLRGRRAVQEGRRADAELAFERAAQASPSSADPHVEMARLLLAEERSRDALAKLDEALARAPEDAAALFLRGMALLQLGSFAEAALELSASLEKRPEDEATRRALGLALLRLGRHAEVIEVLAPLVRQGSRDALVFAMYGASLVELGRGEEAITHLQDALRLRPNQPQALLYLGLSLQQLGRDADAVEILTKGASPPGAETQRFLLALVESEVRLGKHREARDRLGSLLNSDPSMSRAWFLMGLLETEDGRHDAAADCFRRAIELGYEEALVHLQLGISLRARKEDEAALRAFDEAIERDDELSDAYFQKGSLLLEQGFGLEAIGLLERAIALTSDSPEAALGLSAAYLRIGRADRAITAADLVQGTSLEALGSFFKGRAQQELEDLPGASASFRKALALGLDSAECYWSLGRALYEQGQTSDAGKALSQALARAPDLGGAHLLLARIEMESGDDHVALRHLLRATELEPQNAEFWYQRGVAEIEVGDTAAAIVSWRRALQVDHSRAHSWELNSLYYRLGMELMRQGNREEGQRYLQEFHERSTRAQTEAQQFIQMDTLVRRALEHAGVGEDTEAMDAFAQALAAAPWSPQPYVQLAQFHLSRQRPGEAARVLEEGLQAQPDSIALLELLLAAYEAAGDKERALRTRRRLLELNRRESDAPNP